LYNERVSSETTARQCRNEIFVMTGGRFSMEILKVSSHSSPNSVAGAIAGVIREKKMVEVQAVGAGAANQAVKAIAIARGYLAPIGVDLVCIPAFANILIDGEERTAIKLICEER
jgi:stage V sporulation protein S